MPPNPNSPNASSPRNTISVTRIDQLNSKADFIRSVQRKIDASQSSNVMLMVEYFNDWFSLIQNEMTEEERDDAKAALNVLAGQGKRCIMGLPNKYLDTIHELRFEFEKFTSSKYK